MNTSPQAALRHEEDGQVYLTLPAQCPAVLATRGFVRWDFDEDRALVPVHLALWTFLASPKNTLSQGAEHRDEFNSVNALNFNLNEEAWSTIISALEEAGVFTQQDMTRKSYINLLRDTSLPHAAFTITPDDLQKGEPFDEQPAPAPRARGRGRGAREAEPAPQQSPEPGDPNLRFLALCPITSLLATRGPPLGLIARLAGMLGPCLAHKQRRDETSAVRVVAAILAANIRMFLGLSSAEHPVLAAQLRTFVEATELPLLLCENDTSTTALTAEASDGIR